MEVFLLELKSLINSPQLWIASAFIVVVIIAQSVLFMKKALEAAKELNMPRDRYIPGIRAAAITAIGPSLGPVIILIALITIIGAPTTWMSLCDIGAARTEMAVAAIGSNIAGVDLQSPDFGVKAFVYALWAIAINNVGWMLMSLISTPRMNSIIKTMNTKYDPKWVKTLMGSSLMALFAALLASKVINSKFVINQGNLIAGVSSALCMVFITKVLVKFLPRLGELSLGISMIVGMFVATLLA